jgi:23S rRNA U2552 (ribose-2'-O)-methylase RlmE/FtsJ
MIYFLLPQAHSLLFHHIQADVREQEPSVSISHSLCKYMSEIKEKISHREKEWDIYKKYTNPFEYIHSIVPHKKKAVSKYKPISRSYFKMIEIISEFQIIESYSNVNNHCASDCAVPIANMHMNMNMNTNMSAVSYLTDKLHIYAFPMNEYNENQPKTFLFPISPPPPGFSKRMQPIRTFHLAEGPGGFIEAVCNKRNNREDLYFGMTILVDEYDDNIPAWNKTGHYLTQHQNIQIETGDDGTGNLLHIENFDYCAMKYGGTMDLVTADGGFDFSKDFNKQEISITNLLWGQVCYALVLQRKNGNFVLKMFDCFYEHTIDILYILSSFYSEVRICKLQTSRVGNSEKYVICKGFRFSNSEPFISIIRESFKRVCVEINPFSPPDETRKYAWRLLNMPVPRYFTKQIEEMNAVFGQQQIENIHYTISLIDKQLKTEKSDQILRQNINKCVNWCIEHEIPYNNLISANVFSPTFENNAKPNTKYFQELSI